MNIAKTSAISFVSKVAASAIGFLTTIYLANTLGSDVLGSYFLAVAVIIWLQVLGVMGVQSAITKRLSEKEEDDAYFVAGVIIVLGSCCFLAAITLLFRGRVNAYIGAPVAVVIAVTLFAGAMLNFVAATLRGQHSVHIASLLKPFDRLLRSLLQVIVVSLGFGVAGLLGSYLGAAFFACIAGVIFIKSDIKLPTREHFIQLFRYARYSWIGKLGMRTFASLDTVVLGFFVASNLISYYEIAWNLATILAIFGVAISQATFPELSKVASDSNTERVERLVSEAVAYTGLLLIPGLVGSYLIGDRILSIYGSEFQRASTILVVLVLARLLYAYGSQFLNALNGLDQPKYTFRINGLFVITNIVLNVILIGTYGWVGAAVATTISAALVVFFGYRALTRFIDVRVPTAEISKQILASLVMGGVVYVVRLQTSTTVIATLGTLAIAALTYFVALISLSGRFRTMVWHNISDLAALSE